MPSIKSRRTSLTGDERHNKRKSDPRVDSLKESQLAAGRTFSSASDVADTPHHNSKPQRGSAAPDARATAALLRFVQSERRALGFVEAPPVLR